MTRSPGSGIIPILALYAVAAVFLLPWLGTVRSQEEPPTGVAEIDVTRIADYDIQVRLDATNKSLTGTETIAWTNAGGVPAEELQFHLYMNAFRSPDTRFFEQYDGWSDEDAGWIEVTELTLANGTNLLPAANIDETVMTVPLPQPVQPGELIHIDVGFTVQLPHVFSRTGYSENYFFIAQWFPKLGVFSDGRWICPQFTSFSEFYADFGRYQVDITVPREFEVGATGIRERARTEAATKTLSYTAYPVHDFAWTASPHFRRTRREMSYTDPEGNSGSLELHLLMHRDRQYLLPRYEEAVRRSLENFTSAYGAFPYPKLVVVDPAPGRGQFTGGMEYPMLITGGSSWLEDTFETGGLTIEGVTAHEFGHQYWYGAVANDEFHEPWIDEGLTSFTSSKVEDSFGPATGSSGYLFMLGNMIASLHPFRWDFAFSYEDMAPLMSLGQATDTLTHYRNRYLAAPDMAPITATARDHPSSLSYIVSAYDKPELAFRTLQNILGPGTLQRALRRFYETFRFRHATGAELRALIAEVAERDLDWFFEQVFDNTGILDYAVTGVEGNTVTVERLGQVRVPQSIHVVLSTGSILTVQWDSQLPASRWMDDFEPAPEGGDVRYRIREGEEGRWMTIDVRGDNVTAAMVDPDYDYLLDVNLANNSYRIESKQEFASRTSLNWIRLMSRWLHGVSAYN